MLSLLKWYSQGKKNTETRSWWQLRGLLSEPTPWSQNPAMFSDHKSGEKGDMTFFICHMASHW